MACCRIGNKPLSEPMLTWFTDTYAALGGDELTHWGRMTHICVSKLTIIGLDNGLSPGWRKAIIWTNAGILLIGPLGANFSEILIEILTFSFKKIQFKVSSGKWRPFCLGLIGLKARYKGSSVNNNFQEDTLYWYWCLGWLNKEYHNCCHLTQFLFTI